MWIYFAVAIVLAPAVLLFATQPRFLYERYFLLPLMLLIMLLGMLLARGIESRNAVMQAASVVAMLAMLAANLWQTAKLIRLQRGQYSAALTYIADQSPADQTITIASDFDARHQPIIRYHARMLRLQVDYLEHSEGQAPRVQWYIAHRFHNDPPPSPSIAFGPLHSFQLVATFDYASLSGWELLIYESVASAATADDNRTP
jgi:hypothetical protein